MRFFLFLDVSHDFLYSLFCCKKLFTFESFKLSELKILIDLCYVRLRGWPIDFVAVIDVWLTGLTRLVGVNVFCAGHAGPSFLLEVWFLWLLLATFVLLWRRVCVCSVGGTSLAHCGLSL